MENGNKEEILKIIKAIEKKKIEMEEYISNLTLLTRKETLKAIRQDIIKNNSLFQELIETEEKYISSEEEEKYSIELIIENYIEKIHENPYKRVIFFREFLELFHDRISEKDKEVILKSLKDEQNDEKLRERMLSLANIFKLNL